MKILYKQVHVVLRPVKATSVMQKQEKFRKNESYQRTLWIAV